MGDMATSVNYHYSKGNIEVLKAIVKDITIDEEDREMAKEYIKQLEKNRRDGEERE